MWCIFIPSLFQQPLTSFLCSSTVWVFSVWYHIPCSELAGRLKKSAALVFMKHCKGIMSWLIPPPPPISYYYKKTKSLGTRKVLFFFFFHLEIVSTYNLQRNVKPRSPVTSDLTSGPWRRGTVPAEPRKCLQTETQDPDLGSVGQGDYLAP